MTLRIPPRVRELELPSFAAVLWDFDGTLVDSEPLWLAAEERVVHELGGTVPEGFGESLVGNSLLVSGELILSIVPPTELGPADIVARLVAFVEADLRAVDELPWRPGAKELLAALVIEGVPMALVSASYRGILDAMLDRLPAGTFAAVVAGEDVEQGKPHPDPYLRAASLLGVQPADCLVIEDSATGAASGNAAGCQVLAVPNVVVPPPATRRIHADTLAGVTPEDLRSWWRRG